MNSAPRTARDPAEARTLRAIELLFYAYRDFVGDPDAILTEHGLGRAHHRTLHFVGRDPGMTVAELLDVLKITKQSLNRVLQTLVARGHVRQEPGSEDRRQRRLFLTEDGERLWKALRTPQLERFARAYRAAGEDAFSGFETVLAILLNEPERERILARVERP